MSDDQSDSGDAYLQEYKGYRFLRGKSSSEYIQSLEDFEIRDSDVFLMTYPKSGTVWTQQIVTLIFEDDCTEDYQQNFKRMPWIEFPMDGYDFVNRPSPRLYATHLPYHLVPKGLKEKKAKVIYVFRNPKDTMVSFFHFSNMMNNLETMPSITELIERYLNGKVLGGSWFDHVKGWYDHKDQVNILFLSYEEISKDLRSAVLKISKFVGKQLEDATIDKIVERSTFKNMMNDPKVNFEFLFDHDADKKKGHFMRKGTVGDWKNTLTVAQNEYFDKVFQAKMKGVPLKMIWNLDE
ncbi:amine sulfotransferase-like isoform X2 [Erpetoichthys calabaricus]|uniref:amine sulfotransferase-like isoform X2 n=1 Tax=Erpetoichthys calabaricus TaxID=27687 RepID=UPI002233FE71|nr:amine sulfotransferase-like isoform X2 [Erpetoichthys calabaricus]